MSGMQLTGFIAAGLVAIVLCGLCNLSFQESSCEDTAKVMGLPHSWKAGTGCMVQEKGHWRRIHTAADEMSAKRRTVIVGSEP